MNPMPVPQSPGAGTCPRTVDSASAAEAKEALWFALPGLVHQLGNALFAVQGHVMSLARPEAAADDVRRRILGATERAGGALAMLRCLLPDSADLPVDAPRLLHQVADLLRVPMHERGLRLDLSAGELRASNALASATAARRLVAGIRCLVGAVPAGVRGTVQAISVRAGGGGVQVLLAFVPDPGALPFPLDYAAVSRCIDTAAGPAAAHASAAPPGVELLLPAADGRSGPEASGSLHECLLPPT